MIQVYLAKSKLTQKDKNGKHKVRYHLRWQDEDGKWRSESTGLSDKLKAQELRSAKKNELDSEPAKPRRRKPSWDECRKALQRAMEADNLRPTSISDALTNFNSIKAMFPNAKSPADITPAMANEYKRQRSETSLSAWTVKGDLSSLKAIYGKWLIRECGLLQENPFQNVKPPKCDDPEIRIVAAKETEELFEWLAERWNNWHLPICYLQIGTLVGWRATELASMRSDDLLPDGYIRIVSQNSKTRKTKIAWLPNELHEALQSCSANGWVFGRFADDLRRLLMLWHKRPHHAATVKEFDPKRLVGWLQDELKRFNKERAEPFTLHDFRRTAITGLQMAGVTEKEASLIVGATPEVIRRHYERMDAMTIAKRSVERRLNDEQNSPRFARFLRDCDFGPLDDTNKSPQTITA